MLLLRQTDVRSVLTVELAFQTVARGCVEYSQGHAVIPPRAHLAIPESSGDSLFMPGYLPKSGAYGVKIVSSFARNPERGLPVGPGLLVLLDPETGVPLAVMDASYLTDLRTGVLSGLAARYLARPDSCVATLVGSGAQARTQVLALAHVLPLRQVLVYSRRPMNVEAFIRAMRAQMPTLEFTPMPDAEPAVRKAQVVVAATTSDRPVVLGEWVQPGTLVCGVGSHTPTGRELDGDLVRKASRLAVDSRAGALKGAGDLAIPLAEGAIRADDVAELGELIAGQRPGRRDSEEIAVFKSVGFAPADLTTAAEVYRRARELNLGQEISILE